MQTNLLESGGVWLVTTQTSSYIVDAENSQAKRIPSDASSSIDYDVTSLRKDGEWFSVVRLEANIGESMKMLAFGISNSSEQATLRQTTPVVSITRV
jgi:hypothetical protein